MKGVRRIKMMGSSMAFYKCSVWNQDKNLQTYLVCLSVLKNILFDTFFSDGFFICVYEI